MLHILLVLLRTSYLTRCFVLHIFFVLRASYLTRTSCFVLHILLVLRTSYFVLHILLVLRTSYFISYFVHINYSVLFCKIFLYWICISSAHIWIIGYRYYSYFSYTTGTGKKCEIWNQKLQSHFLRDNQFSRKNITRGTINFFEILDKILFVIWIKVIKILFYRKARIFF